jgi:hypothetical protein
MTGPRSRRPQGTRRIGRNPGSAQVTRRYHRELVGLAQRRSATRIRNPKAWLTDAWAWCSAWVRRHAVVLAGLALVAGQLGWTAALLAHSYFRQSDFLLLGRALREELGWNYLMWVASGHLEPAGLAVTWGLARISPYNWLLAGGVVMVLVAAASLAMLRMLVTVFARPDGPARAGILIPFAVYLFVPLSAGAVAWLSVALRVLPLQLAMFLAIDAHVRYLRRGRLWALIAAVVWLAVGMAAADQGALVPGLLFALTVGYFVPGRLRDAVRQAAARYWRAWALYGALLAAYCAVFFARIVGSAVPLPGPGQASSVYRFAGTLLGTAALPGFLGGPWQWLASGYAQAAPPAGLQILSWVLAGLVVLASTFFRPDAWRAWAILLGWIAFADVAPVAIRGFGGSVTALGEQTGYLANATGVFALCLGLAFLPAGVATRGAPRPARVIGVAAFCCFAAGVIASLQAFITVTPAAATRSYLATARAALAAAPRGSEVVNGPTPTVVMDPGFFPGQADTVHVVRPLAGRAAGRVTWTSALDGVYDQPMIFDAKGRLRPVVVTGLRSAAPPRPPGQGPGSAGPGKRACWNVTSTGLSIPLPGSLYRWPWTVRLAYSGPAGQLSVRYGPDPARSVRIPAGTHLIYVPLVGSGNAVSARFNGTASARPLCVTAVSVGMVSPDQAGQAVPADPVRG